MNDKMYQRINQKFISEKERAKHASDPLYLRSLGEQKLARLFGVSNRLSERILSGKSKSKLFTKEEIAQILLQNGLVDNREEGLKETDNLIYKLEMSDDTSAYGWRTNNPQGWMFDTGSVVTPEGFKYRLCYYKIRVNDKNFRIIDNTKKNVAQLEA